MIVKTAHRDFKVKFMEKIRNNREEIGKIALMVLSALILFVTANEQSLWLDEVETVSYSDPRIGFAYEPNNAQMPLIYAMIFIMRVLFGSHDMVYRIPILLLSFFMIQLIPHVLVREGINKITTYIAPLLLLLLPQFIYYSQEVRAWITVNLF